MLLHAEAVTSALKQARPAAEERRASQARN